MRHPYLADLERTGGVAAGRRQRGGAAVTMMLLLIGLVAILGLVEIGFLYWVKRDAQKTADLSALAGAQRLDQCVSSNADNLAARQNAIGDNRFRGSVTIQCGNWDPALNPGDHFAAISAPSHPRNAVRVIAERTAIPFFGQNASLPTVRAKAIAFRSQPTASFSVGSQLARINGNTPLGGVLKLVGVDLDRTTLLGYDGLAQAKITPSGLLKALGIPVDANIGVAELNQTLAARTISLGRLLNATADALSKDGVASAQVKALNQLLGARVDVTSANIQLGSSDAISGLFAKIVAPGATGAAALQADVNVLDLITGGIAISNGRRGFEIQDLRIPGALVKAGVIEPPSIAIGGIGAQAYNAQVRVHVDVDSKELPVVGGVLQLLNTRLKLPIYLDLTNAMGTLTGIQCGTAPPQATVEVRASLLNACVGALTGDPFSTQKDCRASLGPENLLTLFGQNVIRDKIIVQGLANAPQSLTLAAGETKSTTINNGAIGTTVSALGSELLRVLSGMLDPAKASHGASGTSNADTAKNIALYYLEQANQKGTAYDIDETIKMLRYGNANKGIKPLGDWTVSKGVPYSNLSCGLGVFTCFKDGSVWDGYRSAVTGQGLGAINGLLGTLLGGLVIERCNSLLGILAYNPCVERNLASYIQTAPDGLLDPLKNTGSVLDPTVDTVACRGVLCLVLKPALDLLKPILNAVGRLLLDTLAKALGIELGRTDVHMQSIQCSSAQLVY